MPHAHPAHSPVLPCGVAGTVGQALTLAFLLGLVALGLLVGFSRPVLSLVGGGEQGGEEGERLLEGALQYLQVRQTGTRGSLGFRVCTRASLAVPPGEANRDEREPCSTSR